MYFILSDDLLSFSTHLTLKIAFVFHNIYNLFFIEDEADNDGDKEKEIQIKQEMTSEEETAAEDVEHKTIHKNDGKGLRINVSTS